MSKENKTKYAILGILSLAPMSGYDIKKITDNSIGHFWNENFGHLYPVLGRLEREGLVSRQIRSTPGRPDRSVYTLTETGRSSFSDWLTREPEDPPTRIELLLQIFFAGSLPRSVVMEKIQREKARTEARLAVYETIERQLGEVSREERDLPFWLMTLSFGKHRSRATVTWCDETMRKIAEMK